MEYRLNGVISSMDERITNVVNEIKRVYGLELKLDTYFSGIQMTQAPNEIYFNVELPDRRTSRSRIYQELVRISSLKTIKHMGRIEPNGIKLLALYLPIQKEEWQAIINEPVE